MTDYVDMICAWVVIDITKTWSLISPARSHTCRQLEYRCVYEWVTSHEFDPHEPRLTCWLGWCSIVPTMTRNLSRQKHPESSYLVVMMVTALTVFSNLSHTNSLPCYFSLTCLQLNTLRIQYFWVWVSASAPTLSMTANLSDDTCSHDLAASVSVPRRKATCVLQQNIQNSRESFIGSHIPTDGGPHIGTLVIPAGVRKGRLCLKNRGNIIEPLGSHSWLQWRGW